MYYFIGREFPWYKLSRVKPFANIHGHKSHCYLVVRQARKINMVLVLWFLKMGVRVQEIIFLLRIFYQLANIYLVSKDRVCEKFET